MPKSIETSGKTVDIAVKNGLKELGCDSSDVDIEILEMGSPGLFGMFGKLAKVRLTMKEKEDDFKIEMPVFSLDEKPAPKKEQNKPAPRKEQPKAAPKAEQPKPKAKEEPAPVSEEKPAEAQEPAEKSEPKPARQRSRRPRQDRAPRENKEVKEAMPQTEETVEPVVEKPFEEIPQENWSEDITKAVEFLANTTKAMGVNITFKAAQDEESITIRMSGDELGILIGRRGETLDALQYLTSLHVNKGREGYLRVSLDSENYRAKREEALRKLANRMAQKAYKTGRRVALEPMNPYERRILHSALQNNPYVQTHSEGEDPYRRVIITIK